MGGRFFYYSVHAFAQGRHHRVLTFGKALSVGELRSVMTDWKVPGFLLCLRLTVLLAGIPAFL